MTTPLPAPLGLPAHDYEASESSLETHPGRGKPDAEPIRKELTMDELTELRATLIQLAKAQETQAACTRRILAMVEKRMGVRPVREAAPVANASIATAVQSRAGV